MDRKLKHRLNRAFEAPPPVRKREFLKALPSQPRISTLDFVLSQAGYICRWTWAGSVLLLAAAIVGARFVEQSFMAFLSALVPFLALVSAAESARSSVYGMEELEQAARFSLKSVVMARMGILGAANLALLCLFIPLTCSEALYGTLRTGIYLLVPYLLTAVLCLWIVRRIHGRESVYACMGAAVIISGSYLVLNSRIAGLYQPQYVIWWLGAAAFLAAQTVREGRGLVRQMEEILWS